MSDTITVRLVLPRSTWVKVKTLANEHETLDSMGFAAHLVAFALGHLEQHPEDWKEAVPCCGPAGPLLTDRQRSIVEHALGRPTQPGDWRNYFCTRDGDEEIEALVLLGLMSRGAELNDGRDRYYHVTPAGKAALGERVS